MEQDVLEELTNEGKDVEVAGKTITAKEFSFIRHSSLVARLLKSFLSQITDLNDQMSMLAAILHLLAEEPDSLFRLITASTGLKKEDLEKLEKQDNMAVVKIAQKVFEVNKDFLFQVGQTLGLLGK